MEIIKMFLPLILLAVGGVLPHYLHPQISVYRNYWVEIWKYRKSFAVIISFLFTLAGFLAMYKIWIS